MRAVPLAAAFGFAVLSGLLCSCSALTFGAPQGSAPAGSTSGASATPRAARCTPDGTGIPDGRYSGSIKATIMTTMTITGDGISIPNAGGGTEAWKGSVDLVAKGGNVSGTITMSELGLSQVGQSGGVQVHSVDDGDLTGTIAGPSTKPTVSATGTGEWASLDAPVVNGSGTSTASLNGGLHITRADCNSISGDAVAMFSDFMSPVAQYLAVSGSGAWTATRK